MSKKVYVVTMYRWGDREAHSYVLGVFGGKVRAFEEAWGAEECRGGKYEPEIVEMALNKPETKKGILPLEEQG